MIPQSKKTVFVFANLKPSQIFYKIVPLSHSEYIEKIYVLRKDSLITNVEKVVCLSLPKWIRIRPIYWLFTAFYGIKLIKKFNASLVLSYNIFPHGFNGFIASKWLKLPLIFCEINEDTLKYFRKPFFQILVKRVLNQAKIITVPGSNTNNRWISNGYNKQIQLHSTIDVDYFNYDSTIKDIDFIYIGIFDSNKRPEVIIDAFNRIVKNGVNANICFIGFGSQQSILESRIAEFNLKGNVLIVKTNNILEYLKRSKIFVMATLSEGIPCAMLEAMSCGLAVVVPPVGDISDVVKPGVNGYLHNNTEQDIKNKMLEAYMQYSQSEELRKNARETIVREHSYQSATAKWDNLFSKL